MIGLLYFYTLFIHSSVCSAVCNDIGLNSLQALSQKTTPITLVSALLRKWDQNHSLPCAPPFKATYKKDRKEFTFIAAAHAGEPVEPEKSELQLIRNEIERIKPKGLLIEYVTRREVMSERLFKPERISHCYQGKKFACGEPYYSAIIAHQLGTDVMGGEPSSQELNQLVSEKVNREDLLAFNSAQRVLMFKFRGVPLERWEKEFNSTLPSDIKYSPKEWSYPQFQKWLKEKLNLSANEVEPSWIDPSGSNPLQKIAAQVEEAREPFILKSAEILLNKYNPTVIVYGSAHFYKQAPAYEKVFGPPKIECLKK